ncbi:hypothetical protein [Actinoalloteichus sp. GBA129-24]|uniref:hypothetical protein n=1 Tax=Actinoalloteichus sp. GBA129-24 TaxID=1612551 RepID=UPI0009509D55|nr:hypothetical protein [Actinoalloteichus sp. GBA129-24]APU20928.1 hypothetical protein UA75_14590 [Actinoalloteichus sp. GBA129-24]APU24177.1 hypothetical protein UA75_31070 [Actinoalloteichus sp. GBA129-24]
MTNIPTIAPSWPTPIRRGRGRKARDQAMAESGRWLAALIADSRGKQKEKEKQG